MQAVLNGSGYRRWHSGHPWIFRDQVARFTGTAGDLVEVVGQGGKPYLGTALLSTTSKITLRRFSRAALTESLAGTVQDRLGKAIARREPLREVTDGVRLVYSETDDLPGLVVDQYQDLLVMQAVNPAMERLTPSIVETLVERLSPRMILGRNDPGVRKLEGLLQEVKVLHGETVEKVMITEQGLKHTVEPFTGQKTGLFLDQRPARFAVRRLAADRRVLDLFCYQGGFTLNALQGGAKEVLAVDASARALEVLGQDAVSNGLPTPEMACGNAFDIGAQMAREGRTFDLIILDPPAFAKNRREISGACRGYRELNRRCLQMLAPGGTLVTCSCSYNMTRELFLEVLQEAAAAAGRDQILVQEIETGEDHPRLLCLPESDYLKVFCLQALDAPRRRKPETNEE